MAADEGGEQQQWGGGGGGGGGGGAGGPVSEVLKGPQVTGLYKILLLLLHYYNNIYKVSLFF